LDSRIEKLLQRCRIQHGRGFGLRDHLPDDTGGLDLGKTGAAEMLQAGVQVLSRPQDMLGAQDRWAVPCIFQAMDAAGQDSAIRQVFSGVNPQGCHVASFKAPRSRTTTSSGAMSAPCRRAGRSASTTGPGTRRRWWRACIPASSTGRSCRRRG
jgi:hypothetical protein